MSEKHWKILGIIGILAIVWLAGKILLLRASSFLPLFSKQTYYSGPEIGMPLLGNRGAISGDIRAKESGEEKLVENIPPSSETVSRMVVKNGWLNLVVKDIKESAKKINQFVNENGGYVIESNIYEQETLPSGYITVRVPAEKFEMALEYFKSLAVRVSNEGTRAQDVTEEYVDLQSRLRNLESAEEQLLEIMKRAGKMSEVLEVHRELTNIRSQIEQTKGRMQYLETQVKMSSITVNLALSEELLPVPPAEKWRPKYVLLQSWKSVLNFWKEFSYFLIRLVVWSQVWLPVLLIIILGKRWWKKRRTN